MQMQLSTIAIFLGALVAVINLFGVLKPTQFAEAARKFSRNTNLGYFLILFATIWFIWNLKQESIADFDRYKPILFGLFLAVGIGTCIFVKDFLAVRGLAVVLLLVAKMIVDAGRPRLGETPWILLMQTWAYVMVFLGIWFTISPWRLRDILQWGTANEKRVRIGSSLRLAFGLLVIVLGLTVF